MEALYVFLIRNDVWIYILCALGFVWYFGQLVRSRGMLKRSMFGLEKERGRRVMSRSLILVFLFIVVAGAVTYVNLSIAPTLPPELLKPPTPTPNIFATPLSSPTPAGGQPTPTIALAPTVTLAVPVTNQPSTSPQSPVQAELEGSTDTDQPPVQDATPTASPTRTGVGCLPSVLITAPPTGAIVSNVITFFGSAAGEDFDYFQLDVRGPQTGGSWSPLPVADSSQQIFDNILGTADVSVWIPGPHAFRLSAYDSQGSVIGQCEIQLLVDGGGAS